MSSGIRIWNVKGERLREVKKTKLDLEERLEKWLESDISMISTNLLIIGRQVETHFGGVIDLLCIEENGTTVIIELKRDKTPREITAQVLDYASWVQGLSAEQIQNIADDYFKKNVEGPLTFEEAYVKKFDKDLPDSINEEHKMLVVGSEIDSSSQRIINYLSEKGIGINALTFNYFEDEEGGYLARTFLIEPSKAEISRTKRRGPPKGKPWESTEKHLKVLQKIYEEGGIITKKKFLELCEEAKLESKSFIIGVGKPLTHLEGGIVVLTNAGKELFSVAS